MFAASLAVLPLISLAAATTYQVQVGSSDLTKQLTFDPYAVFAVAGDVVEFIFHQKNHTVTRTSFNDVCQPLLDTYTHEPVFDTGFHPVAADQMDDFPTYNYTVTDDKPVWLYCRQATHCGKGMVFAINCPSNGTNSFDAFKQAALAFGVKESAQAAASSSWAATATSEVYGGQTYAPVWHPTVTETVTYESQTWSTAYESYPDSPGPTPAAEQGVEHRVKVGGNKTLTFDPPTVYANVRDTIVFEFLTKNHTATQSSFGAPCESLADGTGFDSGFMPVADGATTFPTFNITVNKPDPIWVYCRQATHCGKKMVFAVNPGQNGTTNSFDNFVNLAVTLNGTSSNSTSNSTGQTSSNDAKGAAPAVRASMASAALFVVGGLFVLAF